MQTQDRKLLRVTGMSAMLGAVWLLVFLSIRPQVADPQEIEANLHVFAENVTQFHFHGVGSSLGMLLMLGGMAGLYYAIRGSEPTGWAKLAFVAAVATAPLTMLPPVLDGTVMPAIAQTYVHATSGEAHGALNLAAAFYVLNDALFGLLILALSITLLLYGVALLHAQIYARWLGWIGAAGGAMGLATAIVTLLTGPIQPAQLLAPTFFFMFVLLAWLFLAGVFMWRDATTVVAGQETLSHPG